MIVDLSVGGVLLPGLLVLAFAALAATMAVVRFLGATGIHRLFAYRPLAELAIFVLIYGLLVQCLPSVGTLP
ncbi:hypothetical protein TSH58p_31050 (plasmid) [Azospirillum sp. TSH58]|uniref:DUF1656 domain-containing protein n=1 Tax=Azospirillum sp. TSH58 TaxID=664962 RepID=UPI000D5FF273|nr:DUF1656 domain-containing protein [Azospirillum sp. TSH58]AWJ87940.1 hypothetical protein TSH58p_31050 [Azospirillum sp. TSH58]PWC67461.1 hypothetical protein TSH58_18335 [Azospirillum sp. TSH58]